MRAGHEHPKRPKEYLYYLDNVDFDSEELDSKGSDSEDSTHKDLTQKDLTQKNYSANYKSISRITALYDTRDTCINVGLRGGRKTAESTVELERTLCSINLLLGISIISNTNSDECVQLNISS